MMRGYAIGFGAATQLVTLGFGQAILGTVSVDARALLMGAAWAVNLAVAEWIIRGRPLGQLRARPMADATPRGRSVPVSD